MIEQTSATNENVQSVTEQAIDSSQKVDTANQSIPALEPQAVAETEVIQNNSTASNFEGWTPLSDEEKQQALDSNPFTTADEAAAEIQNVIAQLTTADNALQWMKEHHQQLNVILIQAQSLDSNPELQGHIDQLTAEIKKVDTEHQVDTVTETVDLLLGNEQTGGRENVAALVDAIESDPQVAEQVNAALEKVAQDAVQNNLNGNTKQETGASRPFSFTEAAAIGLFVLFDLRRGGYQTTSLLYQMADKKLGISQKISETFGLTTEEVQRAMGSALEGDRQIIDLLKQQRTEKVEQYLVRRTELELFNILDSMEEVDRKALFSGEIPKGWQMDRPMHSEYIERMTRTLSSTQKNRLGI